MEFRNRLNKKAFKLFFLSAAIAAVSGLIVYMHFEGMRNYLRQEIRQHLMTIAISATFLINPEEHERITKTKDTNDIVYRKNVDKLRAFAQQTLPEIKAKGLEMARESIYTLVPSEGKKWRFVLDTMVTYDKDGNGKIDENEKSAQIGEEYDVSSLPELIRCYREGVPTADTELNVDKWGIWLSGYAPLKDKEGKVVAIVGVDMNVETLALKESQLVQISLITFIAILLTIMLAMLLYRWQVVHEKLLQAQELQKHLVEISSDLIFSLKPDGTISYVSQQIRNYGYEPSSLMGRPLTEFVTFEDQIRLEDLIKRMSEGTETYKFRVSIRTADGQTRQGEWRCISVQHGDGQIFEVWGVFRDLSQLLILNRELQAKADELSKLSEEQSLLLRNIRRQAEQISVLDELVLAAIQQREIASVAKALVEGLQYLFPETGLAVFKHEPSSKSLKLIAGNERAWKVLNRLSVDNSQSVSAEKFQTLSQLQNGEMVKVDDLTTLNSDVAKALVSESYRSALACPLYVGGNFLGFLAAFRDQTASFTEEECAFLKRVANHLSIALDNAQLFEELKRAYEELRQAQVMLVRQERLNALGQMASGISHDIGNALVPLLAYAELLEEHPDPKVREWGKQISIAADDIVHIIQRLRAFYRPRILSETLEPVNLNDIVKQVVDLTKPRWYDMPQREGITIEMVLELDETLPSVLGIPAELREALTNLIFNSVDAIVEKAQTNGKILIRTGKRDGFIYIEITDTGVGMDEETKSRCIEPFFTTKGEKGSGLGLMMVYGTMQRHEGQIEIESELNEGSTFRLLFPIKGAELEKEEQKERGGEEIRPLRILLVDDDPKVRVTLGELLKIWGHNVVTAEDGSKATEVFELALHSKQPFDVVITDWGMPKMNGAELAQKIRQRDQNVSILVVTAWGKEQFVPNVDAILAKPIKSQDLKAALAKVVNERKRIKL